MTENTSHTKRTRLVTWEEPKIAAKAARAMSGVAYLQAMLDGDLPPPPIARLMNFEFAEVEEGRVVFTAEAGEYHYNPIGTVHGGFAATLLDSALGCTVHSILPAGVGYTTIELKVNYIRAITVDTGRLRCIGKIIHRGRRVSTAEAQLVDENGKLYAHGTTTCLIFS